VIVAGFNHHFGFNKEGDYRQLWNWREKYCFEAEEIPEQEVYHETVSSTRIRQAISEGYIQRANAYLDHYYIIKGHIAEFFPPEKSRLPKLREVSVTEDIKLLPALGIYAVTAENGSGERSKGMVIIENTLPDKKRILLNVFREAGISPGSVVRLYFHKRIHGAVNLPDSRSQSKINQSVEEISDLIF
jgi:riboflavin kinase/FMN adenylyltransferase